MRGSTVFDGAADFLIAIEVDEETGERFLVARYVQISTGYAASNFLSDLQEFKRSNPDVTAVVNAYEEHDDVYRTLEQKGGTVLIRGRGIVASRVIQRIWEAREKNKGINILHLNRSAITEGAKYDLARRPVRAERSTRSTVR